jgi:hypothetical protein
MFTELNSTSLLARADRLQRVVELTGLLETAERAEEALIELATKQGLDILRRVDASPPCVLGVVVKARAQAQMVA